MVDSAQARECLVFMQYNLTSKNAVRRRNAGNKAVSLIPASAYPLHLPPQTSFPAPDAEDKKFNSRLVAPIFLA